MLALKDDLLPTRPNTMTLNEKALEFKFKLMLIGLYCIEEERQVTVRNKFFII